MARSMKLGLLSFEFYVVWKGMMCVRECMWHDIICVYECFPTERENNCVYTVDMRRKKISPFKNHAVIITLHSSIVFGRRRFPM